MSTARNRAARHRPHILVVHRWRARYAEYANYLDHDDHAVSYLSTEVGRAAIPDSAARVSVVARTDNLAEVRAAAAAHVAALDVPVGVVALKEDDLLVGARLREDWGCPGPRSADLLPFRDKYVACRIATRAGLATPAYAPVSAAADVRAFGAAHGWPVVVKPRSSSSAEGVVVLGDPAAAGSVDFADGRSWMAQVFDERPIYHVDGVFADGRLGPWRASRYLNSCLDFRYGSVLGSVEVDAAEVLATIGAFARRLLDAMTHDPVVFHLELFLAGRDCALLEVAARAGGAEIAFLWREVHGVDLMRAAFDIQLGRPPRVDEGAGSGGVAGWLLVPAPGDRPCRITEVTSTTGQPGGPYAEVVPSPGEVLPAADSYYEHVGGRFRFRGRTTTEVESAIVATAKIVRIHGAPLQSATAGAGS